MPRLEKTWQIASRITPEAEKNLAGYPNLLRQILFNRGLATTEESQRYLAALAPIINDPMLIKGMGAAVDRIERAIKKGESIVVYGDYDADGVTATVLLVQCLQALGAQASAYIPDRFEEGYGLNVQALRQLKEQGAAIVISVDCGVRSLREAEEARKLNLDLIITDHHTPGPELPNSFELINTKQPGDNYPEKQLAGVGTVFKLACALAQKVNTNGWQSEAALDLVALGTVADLVPLTGENRWMVRQGLNQIRQPRRQGLLSLIGASGMKPQRVTAADIGYMLGPRLNAAGRMDTALEAYRLLITQDLFEAGKLAQDLDNRNRERQLLTRQMSDSAEELIISQDPNALLLAVFDPDYSPGVVGLVASRLVERFYRPAIVGQQGPEFTRASCRSISEFHITRALEQCGDLFENFGGHAAAAGFTIRNQRVPELLQRLGVVASEQLSKLDLRPTLVADAEVPLGELRAELISHLELLEPTGYGNREVSLVSRGLRVRDARPVGREAQHLKLTVTDGRITYDAIAFGHGDWIQEMPGTVDLLYRFEVNEYNGQARLQLNVRDLKAALN